MNTPASGAVERVFAQFLDLERLTRAAPTTEQLAYSLVNDSQSLFGYRHAALVIAGKVRSVTGVSVIEPNAPFVAFVEHAVGQLLKLDLIKPARVVHMDSLSASVRGDWNSLSAPHVFWLPLQDRKGEVFGGLWLARDTPWSLQSRSAGATGRYLQPCLARLATWQAVAFALQSQASGIAGDARLVMPTDSGASVGAGTGRGCPAGRAGGGGAT